MKYEQKQNAVLLLSDGTIFHGKALTEGTAFGEVCFNTGMTGYQEIFTDPSYLGQIMVMASVHIGNYGVKDTENESDNAKIAGLVCRNFSYTNSRAESQPLSSFLEKNNILVITEVDTRALVAYIRQNGSMNAVISTRVNEIEQLKKELSQQPDMQGLELASRVSTRTPYTLGNPQAKYKIAAVDFGIKRSILENFIRRDAQVKVFPYNATIEELEDWQPDGYFLSNGPGDPQPLTHAIELAQQIIQKNYPLFGICLGHQIIALANGIPTYKMHNGHRGINHPVKNLTTGKGEITSQNHGFAVDKTQAEQHPEVEITHLHLNDGTVAGIRLKNKNCFSVQYHPEAGPGPHDAHYLFDEFLSNIKK